MKQRFAAILDTFYENDRIGTDSCPDDYSLEVQVGVGRQSNRQLSCGCWMSIYNYNSFTGPYQDLSSNLIRFPVKEWSHQQEQQIKLQADDGTLDLVDYAANVEDTQMDYSDRFDHPKDGSHIILEEADYSDRFDHPKDGSHIILEDVEPVQQQEVEQVDYQPVDGVDYSERFNHFQVQDTYSGTAYFNGLSQLYRRGGEESMTLRDEQMASQIFVAFGALMVALVVVTFVKCIKHGKELLLPDPAASYEQLL